MSVVYIDALFLLNFVVDYLLLLSAARLAGEKLCRPRLALGAVLGAGYAAVIFLPGMTFLTQPLCRIACAVGMLLCAFGGSRHLLRLSLVFLGVAAAFGGGIFALQLLGGTWIGVHGGVLYSPMDLRVLLLSAAICYVLLTAVFHRVARHGGTRRDLLPVVLALGERRVVLTALVDTGNTLTDPATERPVMVAEGARVAPLMPGESYPTGEELRRPVEALERLSAGEGRGRFRLLPYRAVGVECGLLLALRVDGAQVGKEDYGSILVALSPTPLSDGGGYQALVGV